MLPQKNTVVSRLNVLILRRSAKTIQFLLHLLTLKTSILILLVLNFNAFISIIGTEGILTDLAKVLIEIKDLESRGLLNNLPDNIPEQVARAISLCKDSAGLQAYINETEQTVTNLYKWFKSLIHMLFVTIMLRIYIKRLDKEVTVYTLN